MNFKFAGSQKWDNDYNSYFLYKGVDLLKYQYEWKKFKNEYRQLEMEIQDSDGKGFKLFCPYVYELEVNDKKLVFAAGEITNGIWGFALPEES